MTTERSQVTATAQRVREAARWYVERESGRRLSASRLREWEQWSADADNRSEYEEFCQLRDQFRTLPSPLPSEEELKAHSPQVAGDPKDEWASHSSVLKFPGRRRLRPTFNAALVSAGAAIVVLFTMIAYAYWPLWWHSEPAQTYSTARGEQESFTLPDGSVVTLGGDTMLRVRIEEHTRDATLERGEALFRVRRSAQQRFTVRAQGGSIEAVGTEFDVHNYSNRVQVTVTEGVVKVFSRTSKGQDFPLGTIVSSWLGTAQKPVWVRQGQGVSYGTDDSTRHLQVSDPEQATEWNRGLIRYNGAPLHEIIEDVRRYYSRRIVLDAAVADLNYTGTFTQKNADGWLRNLELIFPVEVLDQGSNIVIRPRSSPGQ